MIQLRARVRKHNVRLKGKYMVNTDHVPTWMEPVGNTTWGKKTSGRRPVATAGHEKTRFTVQLTISKDGKRSGLRAGRNRPWRSLRRAGTRVRPEPRSLRRAETRVRPEPRSLRRAGTRTDASNDEILPFQEREGESTEDRTVRRQHHDQDSKQTMSAYVCALHTRDTTMVGINTTGDARSAPAFKNLYNLFANGLGRLPLGEAAVAR
jgi:hypothetical protein